MATVYSRPVLPVVPALPDPAQVQRIACVMLNGVGDVLCATPAIAAFKHRYPHANITVVMRPEGRALIEGNPHIAEVMFFNGSTVRNFLQTALSLRRKKFDLWVELHVPTFNTVRSNHRDYFRNALLMGCVRATYRLAYGVSFLRPLLTHRVADLTEGERRTINIVDMTSALAAPPSNLTFRKYMPIDAAARALAGKMLPTVNTIRVGLFFGSRQTADVWPEARVLEFVTRLVEKFQKLELVLLGGELERAIADAIISTLSARENVRIFDFVAHTSLTETAALLERCTLFVSTDSGPMHMADALGVPLVALFSSKNHLPVWRPQDPRAVVLNHPVDCGPCLRATCPVNNRCMNLISADEALAAVTRLLNAASPAIT